MHLTIFLLFTVAYIECHNATNVQQLENKLQMLANEFKTLRRRVSPLSQYCQLLKNTDTCGQCICVDDYRVPKKYYCDCQNLEPKRDCLDFYKHGYKVSGVYKVTQMGIKTIQVYCDQTTDGGGWTVIQRRMDGTENFYRDRASYTRGFGSLQHEHWLGNRNIHTTTLHSLLQKGSELRIELGDWNGVSRYAKYSNFQVGNEFTKYKLHVGGYTGNAADSFSGHNGYAFTTIDWDNDSSSKNCARSYHGGWWFTNCHSRCNLNGHYYQIGQPYPAWTGIVWHPTWNGAAYSLKHVEMKVRRKL